MSANVVFQADYFRCACRKAMVRCQTSGSYSFGKADRMVIDALEERGRMLF